MMTSDGLRQRLTALAVLILVALVPARVASATFFDIDGQVLTCNALACGAAGISVGDPLSGFLQVDDAASTPGSTFTETDVPLIEIMVGDLLTSGTGADLGTATLTVGADGEIASGTVLVQTVVDTGLGIANVDITLDAASETWEAETSFLGLGVIASGTLGFTRRMVTDSDGDGIADDDDNCIEIANPNQIDSNGDLFGNACDPDLDNNNIVNVIDLGLFKAVFFSADPDADFNSDGIVNVIDLGVLKVFFFAPPGPSGPAGM